MNKKNKTKNFIKKQKNFILMQDKKFEREILVVPRKILFREKKFQGFLNFKEYNYIPTVLKNSMWIKRKKAEFNPYYQQIIPYGVIVDTKSKSVFVYKRSSSNGYSERRLYNKISLGVGGHIEKKDLKCNIKKSGRNVFECCLLREIREELNISKKLNLLTFGFIKLEDTSIDKDHFGIVYLIELPKSKIILNKSEIASGEFLSLEKLYSLRKFAEGWTRALIKPLFDYYKKRKNN